jgi:hypothetical protein
MIYTVLAIKQNSANAPNTRKNDSVSNNLPSNTIAGKTKSKFFVHCLGRIVRNNPSKAGIESPSMSR